MSITREISRGITFQLPNIEVFYSKEDNKTYKDYKKQ